ncbi:hypothetical protein SDC9_191229 [bioreactor metagenome]|uniref:Uncharacterized protein n=1 Tax=bioreactor metagenome TaxID=1076179 RepID=A0A645HZQ3_9ZZZZ
MIHFGVFKLNTEHVAGDIVLGFLTGCHGLLELSDDLVLDLEVGLQHCDHILADIERLALGQVGRAFQEQDALDQRAGVLALVV